MFRFYPYATDSPERDRFAFYAAAIAIALVWGIHSALEHYRVTLLWFIETPTTLGLYFAIRSVFSKYLWRLGICRAVGLVTIPDLNGTWKGELRSSYQGFTEPIECSILIEQSWTKIGIVFRTSTSSSYNTIAGISVEVIDGPKLTYEYQSRPVATAVETMQIHEGTQWLTLEQGDGTSRLRGDYYNGRGRGNTGQVVVTRV